MKEISFTKTSSYSFGFFFFQTQLNSSAEFVCVHQVVSLTMVTSLYSKKKNFIYSLTTQHTSDFFSLYNVFLFYIRIIPCVGRCNLKIKILHPNYTFL